MRAPPTKHPQGLPRTDKGWQAFLSNVRPPAKRGELSLGSGLVVWMEPSGSKIFQGRIRRKGEKNPSRIPIGAFPAVSVADARRKLANMKSVAAEGRDPALERRRERAGILQVRTLPALVEAYLTRRQPEIAVKTYRQERDLLQGVLVAALGNRLLSDLEPRDIGPVLGGYAARLKGEGRSAGTNANKLRDATRRLFKITKGWGLHSIDDPTAGLAKPAKEAPRDRILFDGEVLVGPDVRENELGRLVVALTAKPSPIGAGWATRIALLLTVAMGFRALEVSALEWKAIDLDGEAPSITVTRSKTKAGLRTLPVPRGMLPFLRELQAVAAKGARYVFPAEKHSVRAEHLHPESLSRAFARACERLGIEGATTHDLRRTCLSGLIELGHEAVAERIAGHTARHVLGRHYDRSARLEPMRIALEAWSSAIDDAVSRAAHLHESDGNG